MSIPLSEFFLSITGKEILPYQVRYGADPFTPTLLNVPTGLGKTDAVLVPWLHTKATGISSPTRFIFTLPRRNLTEQTAKIARERVTAAGLKDRVKVLELMGGSGDNREHLAPDQPAILIGTEDILLSRALNRGYARNPFRWPVDFALLNNDCLWVFDEIQLLSDGLATSAQLAAFRDAYRTYGRTPSVWMSATADISWLQTVDFSPDLRTIELDDTDLRNDLVRRRLHSPKSISAAPSSCLSPSGAAEFAVAQHRTGETTLVIVNTVTRALEIAASVRKLTHLEPLLLHSRFRPAERALHAARLDALPPEGKIVISTQVLEAGIDISAHRLITDLAPWSSLVQRFGRVNRYGDLDTSEIRWIDPGPLDTKDAQRLLGPYQWEEVEPAIANLRRLDSASPAALPRVSAPPPWQHVLRRADLLDLFDTSSDLSGNHIDVSRFIRSGQERDCYLAWRSWAGDAPPDDSPALSDAELCPVPIDELRAFGRKHELFTWDFLEKAWVKVDIKFCYPGMKLLTQTSQGGYVSSLGWFPSSKAVVTAIPTQSPKPEEAFEADPRSWAGIRQTLLEHTRMVVAAMQELLVSVPLGGLADVEGELREAASLHDWGKGHDVMQRTLHGNAERTELLAKQIRGQGAQRHERRFFRHELASALAILQSGGSDLAAYLAAAHHGRIRVTLRSMPGEQRPPYSALFARGIWHGDTLPACDLAPDVIRPSQTLSLTVMQLGESEDSKLSWTGRALLLRDRFGPFRLAFLELLLRAADERASQQAERSAQ